LHSGCATTILQDKPSDNRRISFNADWRFIKDRPEGTRRSAASINTRNWVEATGNEFAKTTTRPSRPEGNLGETSLTQSRLRRQRLAKAQSPARLGHRRPVQAGISRRNRQAAVVGIGWYRKHFTLAPEDAEKQIYLDIDGAMAYAKSGATARSWAAGLMDTRPGGSISRLT
jgi:beta-galactosidase